MIPEDTLQPEQTVKYARMKKIFHQRLSSTSDGGDVTFYKARAVFLPRFLHPETF